MRTRVKICGITRREDALAAVQYGADAIGFVFYDASPRCVNIDQARKIVELLPPFITKVGLFVDADSDWVTEVQTQAGLDLLQFHGAEAPDYCQQFGRPYVKAVHMQTGVDLRDLESKYAQSSGLLLDTYAKNQAGGTGRPFNWNLIPKNMDKPIILAGGLTPGNVSKAIVDVSPYAVDVSSGVERDKGIKDIAKIAAFMDAVRGTT